MALASSFRSETRTGAAVRMIDQQDLYRLSSVKVFFLWRAGPISTPGEAHGRLLGVWIQGMKVQPECCSRYAPR